MRSKLEAILSVLCVLAVAALYVLYDGDDKTLSPCEGACASMVCFLMGLREIVAAPFAAERQRRWLASFPFKYIHKYIMVPISSLLPRAEGAESETTQTGLAHFFGVIFLCAGVVLAVLTARQLLL